MKKVLKCLKDNRGETLVESLVSILIFTLASVLFLTMVSAATRINATAKAADERLKQESQALEFVPAGAATVEMSVKIGSSEIDKLQIQFTGDKSGLFAFYSANGG